MGESLRIYSRKKPLRENEKEIIKERLGDRIQQTLAEDCFFAADERLSSKGFREVKEVYDNFLKTLFQKAASKEYLTEEEKNQQIGLLTGVIGKYYETVNETDERLLKEFINEEETEEDDLLEGLAGEIESLEEEMKWMPPDSSYKKEAKEALGELRQRAEFFQQEVVAGRRPEPSQLTTAQKEEHAKDTKRLPVEVLPEGSRARKLKNRVLRRSEVGDFDAKKIAEELVEEYENVLTAHNVFMGLEAGRSKKEIISDLSEVIPENKKNQRERLDELIDEIKKEYSEGKPDPVTTFRVYRRILEVVFTKKKEITKKGKKEEKTVLEKSVFGFGAGTFLLGVLAPQMAIGIGEFGKTGERKEIAEGAGFSMVSSFLQTELELRLGKFLNRKVYSRDGIVGNIHQELLNVSPEMFGKTEQAVIHRYVLRTVENIERVVETTLLGVGTQISRIVGLSASLGFRMKQWELFLPILLATAINTGITYLGSKNQSKIKLEVEKAESQLFHSLDELMKLRASSKKGAPLKKELLEEIKVLRNNLEESVAKYKAIKAPITPALFLINALIVAADDFPKYAETSVYSLQLTEALDSLISQYGQLTVALAPTEKLVDLVQQFQEEGGEVAKEHRIEFYDIKKKALEIKELEIKPGEMIAVVGSTGAGKTTFFELLCGMEDRSGENSEKGIMLVDGIVRSRLDKKEYRDGIAISNQFFPVVTASLKDNIVEQGTTYDENFLLGSIKNTGLDEWLEKVNKKKKLGKQKLHEEVIMNSDADPSGGEIKLISLAAIDYQLKIDPSKIKTIIIDEPSAGLDIQIKKKVYKMIRKWRDDFPDKTIVFADHYEHMFDEMDEDNLRILGIEKGGQLSQDESLKEARENQGSSFAELLKSVNA